MQDAAGAVVAFEHVTKRYAGADAPAVNDLTLTIPAGEICVLVGPSGCGKTTTMKMVNRLIEPTSGRITIDGTDVMSLPAVELRRTDRLRHPAGRPLPAPHRRRERGGRAAPPALEAAARRRARGRAPRPRRARPRYVPGSISERAVGRRAPAGRGRARALAADPPLMLMDEPFGAVDPILRDRLQNEFLRLQERVRKTIVFVTHDVDEAIKMADRIAILQRGGVLAQYDTPDAILANPASRVRRALRRRGPRPEAPQPGAGARPRPHRAGHRPGRGHARRGATPARRGGRPPLRTARRRAGPADGLDRPARPRWRRADRPGLRGARALRPSSPRRPCATRSRRCSSRRCSSAWWSTSASGCSASSASTPSARCCARRSRQGAAGEVARHV